MEKYKDLTTIDEIRAFTDPYRMEIINTFYAIGEPATVKQIADEMGEVPANVYYHVKKLEKAGILHLVYTKEINGIIAKYYEPTAERYNIDRPGMTNSSQTEVFSQTGLVVSNAFDRSKKEVLDSFNNRKEGVRLHASLSYEKLYITEDEFNQIREFVEDLCSKHNKKREGYSEYSFFFSMVEKMK